MPKHIHQSSAGSSSLSLFPPLPSIKDERELQQTAYQLKLCYKSLDDGNDALVKKADMLKKIFIAKYHAMHFGEQPHDHFMDAISYYVEQYESYLEHKSSKPMRKPLSSLSGTRRQEEAKDAHAGLVATDEFSKILKVLNKFKPLSQPCFVHEPTEEDFIAITKAANELKVLYALLGARFHAFSDVTYKTENLFTMLHRSMFGDGLNKQNFLQEVDRFSTYDVSSLPREVEMRSFTCYGYDA
jgi:hypothetical protein